MVHDRKYTNSEIVIQILPNSIIELEQPNNTYLFWTGIQRQERDHSQTTHLIITAVSMSNNYSNEVVEFMQKTGSYEIFVELGKEPKNFTSLIEQLDVSHTTISNRLKEGRKHGIWKESIKYPDPDSKKKVYELQPEYQDAFENAVELSIPSKMEQQRKLTNEIEDSVRRVFIEN
jgi:DNA-binding HxlR family transcriptional regulator